MKSFAVALATIAMLGSYAIANEGTEPWKFHHIGVVVADFERSADWARSLGLVDCPAGFPIRFPSEVTIEGVSHTMGPVKRVRFSSYDEDRAAERLVFGRGVTCRMGPIMMELSRPFDLPRLAADKP